MRIRQRVSPFAALLERLARTAPGPQTRRSILVGCAMAVALAGTLDEITGPGISFALLYLIPIAIGAWLISTRAGLVLAVASAAISLGCDLRQSTGDSAVAIFFWNAITRLGVFALVVLLLSAVRRQTRELNAAVEARTAELQNEISERRKMASEIITMLQDQKRDIAHELHDGLAQFLTGTAMHARHLEQELRATFSPHAEPADQIVRLLNDAVGQTRQIAYGLSPVAIGANELISALKRLAADTAATFAIRCELSTTVESMPASAEIGLNLYRIAQQAIDNAIRHGSASAITIAIEADNLQYQLAIVDNGRGFAGPAKGSGIGLRTMRFRADLLGAELKICSAPNSGTRVEVLGPMTGLVSAGVPALSRQAAAQQLP